MNPHDPTTRPGSHLVTDVLGVEADELAATHPSGDPRDALGRMVAAAAVEFDELHSALTSRARSAIEILQPYARGENADLLAWSGVLHSTGLDIELLAARRGTALKHLTRLVHAYQRLVPEPAAPSDPPEPVQDLDLATQKEPGRHDAWAVAGERQIVALRAVEQGELRLCRTAVGDDPYLSDGSGNRPAVLSETVERLLADGLLAIDTSTSVHEGQLLSLTGKGEAALHAAAPHSPAQRQESAASSVSPSRRARNSAAPAKGSTARPTPAQVKALEEIARGEAVLKERSGQGSLYVDTGSLVRISPGTVESLRTNGWIARDTSVSLFRGQQLSLTDQGMSVLQAARDAGSRVSAALNRSRPARSADPRPPDSSPTSPTRSPDRPSRSR